MVNSREYDIAFVGLKPGIHEYNYEITDKFFEAFQQQDFTNCHAQIKLLLDKKSSFMMLKFEIGGDLMVVCDRCNNDLKLNLWDEFNMTIKMVAEPELMNDQEEDPDVFYISRGESHINVENWIYEFINLSIPMHKTCNEQGGQCNEDALKMLDKLENEETEKPDTNPIWKGLEQFKKKKD
ncbi:YceD family protein [Niabella insulamsoli]|uniref:YceD family protein n=1 Tax=Niabella insulamsoli TaxID=3144874 RepID=UPI0031FCDA09